MSRHCTGSRMADVHTPPGLEGTTGQLAPLWDSIFVSVLSPSTVCFEDGAKNYSVLTHSNFIKQVSRTVGQRWLIAVAMEVQELGIFTSCHIRLHRVQISCLPEKGRLEGYQAIIFLRHAAHIHFSLSQTVVRTTAHTFGIFFIPFLQSLNPPSFI